MAGAGAGGAIWSAIAGPSSRSDPIGAATTAAAALGSAPPLPLIISCTIGVIAFAIPEASAGTWNCLRRAIVRPSKNTMSSTSPEPVAAILPASIWLPWFVWVIVPRHPGFIRQASSRFPGGALSSTTPSTPDEKSSSEAMSWCRPACCLGVTEGSARNGDNTMVPACAAVTTPGAKPAASSRTK